MNIRVAYKILTPRLSIVAAGTLTYATSSCVIQFEIYWYRQNSIVAICKLLVRWLNRLSVCLMKVFARWWSLVHTRLNVIQVEEKCWYMETFMLVLVDILLRLKIKSWLDLVPCEILRSNVPGAWHVYICVRCPVHIRWWWHVRFHVIFWWRVQFHVTYVAHAIFSIVLR